MLQRKITASVVLLLLSAAANATQITIDFDDYTIDAAYDLVTSSGFRFEPVDSVDNLLVTDDYIGLSQPGDNYLHYNNGYIQFSRADGGLFDLHSIDVHHWTTTNPFGDTYSTPYWLKGYRANGSVVEMDSDTLANYTWHTLDAAADWSQLEYVTVSGSWDPNTFSRFAAIDNIVVSNVVPLPGAVWLFVSGFALLGWRRTAA